MVAQKAKKQWFVYIVRCRDNTFYTGITTNLDRRVIAHNSPKGGASYTRGRQPVALIYSELWANRSLATKREYAIKKMTKFQKLRLVSSQLEADE